MVTLKASFHSFAHKGENTMRTGKQLYQTSKTLDEDYFYGWRDTLSPKELEVFNQYVNEVEPSPPTPKTITLTEDMFKSGRPVAQGEVNIWMKKYAPKPVFDKVAALNDMQEMKLENGRLILGHSETGHHHVLEPTDKTIPVSKAAQAMIDAANDTFVDLRIASECRLVHMRGHDTHGGFILPPGEYIRGLREEQTVEGWRRVAD